MPVTTKCLTVYIFRSELLEVIFPMLINELYLTESEVLLWGMWNGGGGEGVVGWAEGVLVGLILIFLPEGTIRKLQMQRLLIEFLI